MIDRDEIDEKANEFRIHSSNVQRDYVFGWILCGIYSISALKNHLILKGGNCLRKAYFESTRYSSDLDFSIVSKLSNDFIKKELNKVCDFVQEQGGISFDKQRNIVRDSMIIDKERTVHEARLYFKDFYGNSSSIIIKVKLDITQFDKVYLPVQSRKIIHPYSDYKSCKATINCLKLEEVFASKLKCLLQRRQSNDLYDYVTYLLFNLKDVKINKAEIVSTFLKMTTFGDRPGVAKSLLIDLPFSVIKSVWNNYVICPKSSFLKADDAIKRFKGEINSLFGSYSLPHKDFSFFSSDMRNAIMESAASLTMLKLKYDGVTRLVEPYALAFKRKKNGVSKEYFYVYDNTGGNSGPGIKSFVNEKVSSLSKTTQKFEPRFEVELSKSFEADSDSYFRRPFRGRSRSAL